jgi:hypothetical protein
MTPSRCGGFPSRPDRWALISRILCTHWTGATCCCSWAVGPAWRPRKRGPISRVGRCIGGNPAARAHRNHGSVAVSSLWFAISGQTAKAPEWCRSVVRIPVGAAATDLPARDVHRDRAVDRLQQHEKASTRRRSHVLVLFATSGMMILAAARDLMIIFLGIELMSIAVYRASRAQSGAVARVRRSGVRLSTSCLARSRRRSSCTGLRSSTAPRGR